MGYVIRSARQRRRACLAALAALAVVIPSVMVLPSAGAASHAPDRAGVTSPPVSGAWPPVSGASPSAGGVSSSAGVSPSVSASLPAGSGPSREAGRAASGSWPSATGEVKVSKTTEVSGAFDGGLKRYYGVGDGGSSESQAAVFNLASGATLKNVILGAPAGDGVHCAGSCTLSNVWWEDVGEDAATFRGPDSAQYVVDGGGAKSATDKVFQHNGGGTVTIRGFQVSNFGKLYRSCGNCKTQYTRHVVMSGIQATGPGKTLVGINTNYHDTATISNVTISGTVKNICTRFTGNSSGSEPQETGSGADGTYCKYSESDIHRS